MKPQTRVLRPRAVAFAALTLALACQAQRQRTPAEEVNWLVSHGRYEEAVKQAAELAQADSDDPQRAELWRMASAAWRLENGRRLTFRDQDVEALAEFEAALELAPEAPQVRAWVSATLDKLAGRWVDRAIAAHAGDDLEEAVRCYELALGYRPDDRLANDGLARALLQINYRRGMGEAYYERGVKALSDFWLEQAAHHFSSTLKYDENDRAELRRTQTATLRAENRVLIAIDLEEAGQYAAARNEYRIATLFDPAHAEALAGLERTRIEERATEFLREADRRMLKGEFDAAQKALDEGEALTQRQQVSFAAERERLVDARLNARYEAVRTIESDHRYEEAIAAYEELLAQTPQGFYKDAIARRDSLVDSVQRAQAAYDEALTTEDLARRVSLLRQVMLVHPEFRDTRERLAKAEAELAASQAPTDG